MKFLLITFCLAIAAFIILGLTHPQQQPNQPLVVILLGPPGSGKGTQATRISKELGIPHISTGDLFRDNLKRSTPIGKRAKEYMDAGKLVPDEIVIDMLFDRVSASDASRGYLLDGFPRTIAQAEALDKKLSGNVRIVALNLEVSDDVIVKRAEGRLTCKGCGNVYNRYFSPPQKEGVCDKCGGELIRRSDDDPLVVKERLRVYHEQTKPLIQYYAQKNVLTNVNGENPPDQVFKDLMQRLK